MDLRELHRAASSPVHVQHYWISLQETSQRTTFPSYHFNSEDGGSSFPPAEMEQQRTLLKEIKKKETIFTSKSLFMIKMIKDE